MSHSCGVGLTTLHLNSCSRITQLAAECEKLLRADKRLEQFVAAARLALA